MSVVDGAFMLFKPLTPGRQAPERPDHELALVVPGPPMMDEQSAAQVKTLIAKGALGGSAFETDDCRGTYAALRARGVVFLSEKVRRFYGIEATLRDNSGNWFSMTAHRGTRRSVITTRIRRVGPRPCSAAPFRTASATHG